MSFFHTTPEGRIINRLTKDTADVDKNLADFSAFFIRSCMQLASTIIIIGTVVPFALPALGPILLFFYFMYQYFQVCLLPLCHVSCAWASAAVIADRKSSATIALTLLHLSQLLLPA